LWQYYISMKSVIISLGYNCTSSSHLLHNKNYLIPSIVDFSQINIDYLITLLSTDFDLNYLKYHNGSCLPIIDTRFPDLGNLFHLDLIKFKHIYKNMVKRSLEIFKNNQIKKILIYHTNPIAEDIDNLVKKFNHFVSILNQKINHYELILVATCQNQSMIHNKIKYLDLDTKYIFSDTGNVMGDFTEWKNLIDKIFNDHKIININYLEKITHIPLKKINVAILISGEWRVNHTGYSKNIDSNCGPGILKNTFDIFSNSEYNKYDCTFENVDTFISTDNLDLEKTYNYYKNIKSIYLSHNSSFHGDLKEMGQILENKDDLFKGAELRIKNFDPHMKLHGSIYQWYRLLICKNMMEQYEKENKINYDIVIRVRPDIIFNHNLTISHINELIEDVYSNNNKAYMDSDFFAIGTREIMNRYCTLIYNFGQYIFTNQEYDFDCNGIWYKKNYYVIQDFER